MQLRYRRPATETSLSGLVGARFLMLEAEARTVVGCAALLGYRFEVSALVASTGVEERGTLAALRHAQRLGLIVVDPDGLTRYRFRHELTQAAIREHLGGERQSVLHGMIAAALEASPDASFSAEKIAHHWAAGGNAERATLQLERAARAARLLGL